MESRLNKNTSEAQLISNKLFFDDAPLDQLLSGADFSPTPTNAIELWRNNLDRSDEVARAVAAIFARNSDSLDKKDDFEAIQICLQKSLKRFSPRERRYTLTLIALGAIVAERGDIEKAIDYLNQALILQVKHSKYPQDIAETTEKLAILYENHNQPKKAKLLRDELKLDELMRHPEEAVHMRAIALEMFHKQQYQGAERIYQYLLTLKFQLASTYCHLARIYLMTGHAHKAMEQIELAWDSQDDVKPYVIPRLHFFKLIDRMLSKQNYTDILQKIATALNAPRAFEDWDMDKVINHIASELSADEKTLLLTLAETLGDNKKMSDLTKLQLWNKR
ncbi:MAG: hypothetical protein methR_P0620 [Methyloprofundus sp.]|nr:MAG: hypothetical protein methR_P0620 [Methyloprofundus sp.]